MTTDAEVERAQKEYEHIASELARYHSDSQKLVSLVSVTLTLAFAAGVAQRVDAIFPLIPLLTLTLLQYLLANNYDYRVREQYVHGLERILIREGRSVPAFYHSQIKRYFVDLRWWENAVLPFNGAVGYTVILLCFVSVYSAIRAFRYLTQKPLWMVLAYIALGVLMLLHTIITAVWSERKLRTEAAAVGVVSQHNTAH